MPYTKYRPATTIALYGLGLSDSGEVITY